MIYTTRKHSFALAEVLIAMIIISITSAAIIPFFYQIQNTYTQMEEMLQMELLLEEELALAYGSFLQTPPTFAALKEGIQIIKQRKNYSITQNITIQSLEEENNPKNICKILMQLSLHKNTTPNQKYVAQEELELCCLQK